MGLSPDIASQAELINIEVGKSNSRIRNIQFEINKMSKRIESLRLEIRDDEPKETTIDLTEENINEKYTLLFEGIQEAENNYLKAKNQLEIVTTVLSELQVKQHLYKNEYDNLYKSLFHNVNIQSIKQHQIISDLYKGHCNICNSSHTDLWKSAELIIQSNRCPLCLTDISQGKTEEVDIIMNKLKGIDASLIKTTKDIEENILKSSQLRIEMDSLLNYLEQKKLEKLNIEQSSVFISSQLDKNKTVNEEITNRIQSLQNAILIIEKDKNEEIEKRDKLRDQDIELTNLLNKTYLDAQMVFLPKFRALARAFTGLDVDINIIREINDARSMLSFSLTLADEGRQYNYQLSESQRFFIDIALRMAIVDFVSDGTDDGFMLIDTPEGSLDVAYEANAGEMFAEFVRREHQLIITANLNSSGLVKTFANKTGSKKLNLINMIRWATLSEVQSKRTDLFDSALADILDAMKSGDKSDAVIGS